MNQSHNIMEFSRLQSFSPLSSSASSLLTSPLRFRFRSLARLLFTGIWLLGAFCLTLGATLPEHFEEVVVATGLDRPIAVASAPDGRIFVAEQSGGIRVIRDGRLITRAFVRVPVNMDNDAMVTGLALDPDFAVNRRLYVAYSKLDPELHGVVVRYTESATTANVAENATPEILFELPPTTDTYHSGGVVKVFSDRTLYFTGGATCCCVPTFDGSRELGPEMRASRLFRINLDGSIPSDNPWSFKKTGFWEAIVASGFFDPIGLAEDPVLGRIYVQDANEWGWNEINQYWRGASYGWPFDSGPRPLSGIPPRWAVMGGLDTEARMISAGTVYRPVRPQFPFRYEGTFFAGDTKNGTVWNIDLLQDAREEVFRSADPTLGPVAIETAIDGSLLILSAGTNLVNTATQPARLGSLIRVSYAPKTPPVIVEHPQSQTVLSSRNGDFSVFATGPGPLSYQWFRDDVPIDRATRTNFRALSVSVSSSGTRFHCVVSNEWGVVTTRPAVMTVIRSTNALPVALIETPAPGTTWPAGSSVSVNATATDAEDGIISPENIYWRVDLIVDGQELAGVATLLQKKSGEIRLPPPPVGATSGYFRLLLSVVDRAGAVVTVQRELPLRQIHLGLRTSPPGLGLKWDGASLADRSMVSHFSGESHALDAPEIQRLGDVAYRFSHWSFGGPRSQTVTTPSESAHWTAVYRIDASREALVDWGGTYLPQNTEVPLRDAANPIVFQSPINLDGGFDDARAFYRWDDQLLLSPGAESGYAQNANSARFFGGVLFFRFNAREFPAKAGVRNGPSNQASRLVSDGGPNTWGWDFRYWKKDDFLIPFPADFEMDESTQFEVVDYAGGDGSPDSNSGEVRFVVREGAQFYLSEPAGLPTTSPATLKLADPFSARWTRYDPMPPYSLGVNWSTVDWITPAFANVTAVGYLHSNDKVPAPATGVAAGFSAARFRVTSHVPSQSRRWRIAFFGSENDPLGEDASDPDEDGLPNLLEYALGTHPRQPETQSRLAGLISSADLAGNRYLLLTFSRNARLADIRMEIDASDDLADWETIAASDAGGRFIGPAEVVESGPETKRDILIRDYIPIDALQRRFLRVRVRRI